MSYCEVPANVLEDPDEIGLWARKAFKAAVMKIKKKAKGKTGNKAGMKC